MKKRKTYKKPNPFVYKIFLWGSKLYSWYKLGLKIERNEVKGKKGAYVVIANHASAIDFMPACTAIKRRVHFVISQSFYQSNPIQPLLNGVKVIPKNQFQTSVVHMRKMKAVLDNDMPLVFYPAGLMSENGVNTPIPASTGKSLKWFAKDVYVCKIKGTYLSHPKWSSIHRKGKTSLNIYKLFDAKDLENMTNEEVQEVVEQHLKFDEYADQKINGVKFKNGDNLEGLENVIFKCPHCHNEFSFMTKGNVMTCSNCGYSVKSNEYSLLEQNCDIPLYYDTISAWSLAIENSIKTEVLSDGYTLSSDVKIEMINEKNRHFEPAGEGHLTLNKDEFILTANINGESVTKTFQTKLFPTTPFKPGVHFELQDAENIYRVKLADGQKVIKWIIALKIYFKNAWGLN